MATTSGLSVSPGLGVSVIEWLDHVSGGVRGREMSGVHAGAGRWELVKKHDGGFLWFRARVRAFSLLASPIRIRIRLLNEAPAFAFVFLLCKEGSSITRAKYDRGES